LKPLIVTTSWDDNSHENLKLAKLLLQYGMKGTFYLCSKYDWLRIPFDKDEALLMKELGFEIGGHTATHQNLAGANDPTSELKESKRELEAKLGFPLSSFAYPYGVYSEGAKDMVRSAGYEFARTVNHTFLSLPRDPYECSVTLYAANYSPLEAAKLIIISAISPLNFIDWKMRAISLFKRGLKKGGIYHLYGHSWEIERDRSWRKLEEVFRYISGNKSVKYLNNTDAWRISMHRGRDGN
jgi:peptidoglycan/xylan/chitin deacetylase (PgdA/CDA1 family)